MATGDSRSLIDRTHALSSGEAMMGIFEYASEDTKTLSTLYQRYIPGGMLSFIPVGITTYI